MGVLPAQGASVWVVIKWRLIGPQRACSGRRGSGRKGQQYGENRGAAAGGCGAHVIVYMRRPEGGQAEALGASGLGLQALNAD